MDPHHFDADRDADPNYFEMLMRIQIRLLTPRRIRIQFGIRTSKYGSKSKKSAQIGSYADQDGSVADPDHGPGSGIRNRFFRIPDPKPIFFYHKYHKIEDFILEMLTKKI